MVLRSIPKQAQIAIVSLDRRAEMEHNIGPIHLLRDVSDPQL